MDIDNDPSGLIDSEASRFDTGIDQTPLSGPVVAHGAVAVDVPAFHPVRPVHLGMHCRRSEEHTSELQSRLHLVCRLLLEKKKKTTDKLIIKSLMREYWRMTCSDHKDVASARGC